MQNNSLLLTLYYFYWGHLYGQGLHKLKFSQLKAESGDVQDSAMPGSDLT